jgi:hypothetical protein
MRKVGLLIPDGVGIRNFVYGDFLKTLSGYTEVDLFHTIPDSLLDDIRRPHSAAVHWHSMHPYRQSETAIVLQYAVTYAQMYWADTMAMRRIRSQPVRGSWKMQALHHTTKLIGRAGARPASMRLLDRLHCAAAKQAEAVQLYTSFFQKQRPGIVFCSHQRPSIVLPAILAARALSIPTATFIFSWDNITSKGRIVAPFDHYFVWSEHMKGELLRYYPDTPSANIHIVGTPQFEPYADKSLLLPKEEFFRSISADPNRPLICYSGGDRGTCPEDQEHVGVLLGLIRSGQIRNHPQVIVRPSPADDGKRFDAVRKKFPELLFAQPKWTHEAAHDWSRIIPAPEDIGILANLTQYATMNVNLGSTMTLDFGLHDVPVVNIAFDVASPPSFGMPLWDYYYFFEHYRPVVEYGAARFARSSEQLAEYVNAYLDNPALDREGRRKLFELEVGVPLGHSNKSVIHKILEIAK